MLRALPNMTEELAQAVLEYRREQDFKSLAELMAVVGADVYRQILSYLTLEYSPYYTITAEGRVADSGKKVWGLVQLDIPAKKKYRLLQWRED